MFLVAGNKRISAARGAQGQKGFLLSFPAARARAMNAKGAIVYAV